MYAVYSFSPISPQVSLPLVDARPSSILYTSSISSLFTPTPGIRIQQKMLVIDHTPPQFPPPFPFPLPSQESHKEYPLSFSLRRQVSRIFFFSGVNLFFLRPPLTLSLAEACWTPFPPFAFLFSRTFISPRSLIPPSRGQLFPRIVPMVHSPPECSPPIFHAPPSPPLRLLRDWAAGTSGRLLGASLFSFRDKSSRRRLRRVLRQTTKPHSPSSRLEFFFTLFLKVSAFVFSHPPSPSPLRAILGVCLFVLTVSPPLPFLPTLWLIYSS